MGRFRTFSKHKTKDSSDYNRDLDAKSFYSYSRTKYPCKGDINFHVNYSNYDIDQFKSYDTFLKFSRGMSLLNPYMNFCCDIPTNLDQGIEALLYYPNSQDTARNCKLYSCNCKCFDLLEDVNKCKEIKGQLYPYGYVNNNNLGRTGQFPSRINVYDCADKMDCPKYTICRCKKDGDCEGCKCKTYQEMYPTQYKFVFFNKNSKTGKTEGGKDKERYMNAFSVFPKNEVEEKAVAPQGVHPERLANTKGYRGGKKVSPPPKENITLDVVLEKLEDLGKKFRESEQGSVREIKQTELPKNQTMPLKRLPKKPPPRVKKFPKKPPVYKPPKMPRAPHVGMVMKPDMVRGPIVWKNNKPQPMCCPGDNNKRKDCGRCCEPY